MPTKSQEAERDTSDSSPSSMLVQLRSPIPELGGLKLFKYKLNRQFRRDRQVIKYGPRVRLQEALSMDFIARNTTIQVPRLLDVVTIQGTVHIIQERIDGPILEDVWHLLSPEEKCSSMVQIKDCFDQLRALKPQHPEHVQAVDGSGLIDNRVGSGVWGPFNNHADFHKFLNHDALRDQSETYPRLQGALSKVRGKKYKTVFSHGDFGPHNIIWRDGRIVIIDWERAGWFPEYWDYTRAYAARGYMEDWWKRLREVVDRYDDELTLEVRISEYFET